MSNLLKAIINIVDCPLYQTQTYYKSRNRANNMGEALELFVKDAFAGTLNADNRGEAEKKQSDVFSYEGNQNNPPDLILKKGDAIEVKKIETYGSALALNSSYPKAKLFCNSKMITAGCRNCEDWKEKDIIYAVGVVNENNISQLSFVYGEDYAASEEIYERIKKVIKEGVLEIPDVEFAETNELGRVNRVDPLGITYLRIRGMWHIENPLRAFKYFYTRDDDKSFNLFALINEEKYLTFPQDDRNKIENNPKIKIDKAEIKLPDNPAKRKTAYIITFAR